MDFIQKQQNGYATGGRGSRTIQPHQLITRVETLPSLTYVPIRRSISHPCRKMVMLKFPLLSSGWQTFSMSRKQVTGSLFTAKTMSPSSNKFSAFDPAKQPLTRKTWRRTGSFLTRA